MEAERIARLFRNGRNQAVRIPKDFEMEGREVIIRKYEYHDLTLVTANVREFSRVPDLSMENWLDDNPDTQNSRRGFVHEKCGSFPLDNPR